MSQRTYRMLTPQHGEIGVQIFEFREDGEADRCVLHLAGGKSDLVDTVHALQRAYQDGREDRSEEILGDAGLDRAAAEVAAHRQQGVAMPGQVAACKCGRFEGGTIEYWQRHLACEVLKAAAQLP